MDATSHGGNEAAPEDVARTIVTALVAELGTSLRGVIGHGSWVHGDFAPGRSDLDLLVVLRNDPSLRLVRIVEPVLSAVVQANPPWRGRLELGFVTREAVADVLADSSTLRQTARVSPGEPLHLVTATRHQVLDWAAAARGLSLYGPPPAELMPPIPTPIVHAVVREHLHDWRTWVEGVDLGDSEGYGFQAYAVLTVSRAAALLCTGEHLSKRRAAHWAITAYPQWDDWISWAEAWWYDAGSPDNPPPTDGRSVKLFVVDVAALHDQDV
jgi:predicted nucleotidyltransferase